MILPEDLYRQIAQHLEQMPDFSGGTTDKKSLHWGAKAAALASAFGDLGLEKSIQLRLSGLQSIYSAESDANQIYMTLATILERLALTLPPSVSGAFIPAGSAFDAIAAFSKVVSQARAEVMIVDPYLDHTALSDFGICAPVGVALRLLGDSGLVKPSLHPVAQRWKQQYGDARPLEIRLAAKRTLHDRLIILDGKDPWIMTQSLNGLATRSHAELISSAATAELKIPAYAAIWESADPLAI